MAAGVGAGAAGSSFAGSESKLGSAKGPLVAVIPGAGVMVGIAGGSADFASAGAGVAAGGEVAVAGAGASALSVFGAEFIIR